MKKYKKLAMFGGTFSPFHNGHLAVLKEYAQKISPDAIYIIPTATPPHKMRDDFATDEQRLEMINLSLKDLKLNCEVVVSDMEILRGGKSYTVDTVKSLRELSDNVFIYCGTDMLLTLDRWYDADSLLKTVSVAYMQREDDLRYDADVRDKIDFLHNKYGTEFISLSPVSDEISSSMIREMVQSGESIKGVVTDDVAEYIYNQNLYKEPKR